MPADQLPADKTGYILLNADSTDVVDIVNYRFNADTAFIDLEAINRINEFVDHRGHVFTEGRIGDIDFAKLDQQIIDDSQAWFVCDSGKRNKSRIALRLSGVPLTHYSEDFDGDSLPDRESISPTMAKQKAADPALYSVYGQLQVVKPDGQLLSAEGFGRNNTVPGKYIHDYLASLPTDTYIKLYWQ